MTFIQNDDQNAHLFRALACGYFAHYFGTPFLTRSGRENWFRSKNAERRLREHEAVHIISKNAHKEWVAGTNCTSAKYQ